MAFRQQQQQQQQQLAEPPEEEFDEFILYSIGTGPQNLPHHIMNIQPGSRKITLDGLVQPLIMYRGKDIVIQPPSKETGPPTIAQPFKPTISADYKKRKEKKKKGTQSKSYFLSRDATEDLLYKDDAIGGEEQGRVKGSLIASIGSRINDPDRLPWQLRDAENFRLQGTLEGSQSSTHVLFESHPHGFKVKPVSKYYKFVAKAAYRTLSIEEAEAEMGRRRRIEDRWLMRAGVAGGEKEDGGGSSSTGGVKVKKEKGAAAPPMKAWKAKLMGINPDDEESFGRGGGGARRKTGRDMSDDGEGGGEGMDFEGNFSDDDGDMDFGMEDDGETREAQTRLFKGIEGDGEDEGSGGGRDRKLTRSLARREGDVYENLDPENPYWSEDDESDEDEEEDSKKQDSVKSTGGISALTKSILEKGEKGKKKAFTKTLVSGGIPASNSRGPSASPAPSDGGGSSSTNLKIRVNSGSSSQPTKKQRTTEAGRGKSLSPPPPPSAKAVVKKLERQQSQSSSSRKANSRGPSLSPGPQSASATSSRGNSVPPPSPGLVAVKLEGGIESDTNVLQLNHVVELINRLDPPPGAGLMLSEIVKPLASYLAEDPDKTNMGLLKEHLRKCTIYDKEKKKFKLKSAYK